MASEKQVQSWSTHDLACTHCREKKIRCDRQKPCCGSCLRDGIDCGYSHPHKRINHIKLLCNEFVTLEERLGGIEDKLTAITSMLGVTGGQGLSDSVAEDDTRDLLVANGKTVDDVSLRPITDRHNARSRNDLTTSYQGPCTLSAMSKEFRDAVLTRKATQGKGPNYPSTDLRGNSTQSKKLRDLLAGLCCDPGVEETFDIPTAGSGIGPPPKHCLIYAQNHFFQRVDYTTDIFVQSSFQSHVDRIYNQSPAKADEAWATCFNVIVLIVFGSENPSAGKNDVLLGTVRHFLDTVRFALSNPRILMAPKLINVQALTLLSIAAQRYSSEFAESIFAQACLLARTMGLHQGHATPGKIRSAEIEERSKVLRSLYLLDKNWVISRGSVCWLPTFDSDFSSVFSHSPAMESSYSPRIELARLQEEIYRTYHSVNSWKQPSAEYRTALSRLDQSFDHWANQNDIYNPSRLPNYDAALNLDFFAARVAAFHCSSDPNHVLRTLNDARVSCLLLLISSGQQSPALCQWLGSLLLSMQSLKSLDKTSRRKKTDTTVSKARDTKFDVSTQFQPPNLLNSFSIISFFLIAKNTLWPISEDYKDTTGSDLSLLQLICTCFKGFESQIMENSYASRVGRTFKKVLEIIQVMTDFGENPVSFNDQYLSDDHIPCLSDLSFAGDFSISPTEIPPAMFWENIPCTYGYATDNTTERMMDVSTTLSIPDIQTFSHTDADNDPLSQPVYFPKPQMLPGRKRRQLGDSEELRGVDAHSDNMLFDLMTSNPGMKFDIP